jgi:hypothetical protein
MRVNWIFPTITVEWLVPLLCVLEYLVCWNFTIGSLSCYTTFLASPPSFILSLLEYHCSHSYHAFSEMWDLDVNSVTSMSWIHNYSAIKHYIIYIIKSLDLFLSAYVDMMQLVHQPITVTGWIWMVGNFNKVMYLVSEFCQCFYDIEVIEMMSHCGYKVLISW